MLLPILATSESAEPPRRASAVHRAVLRAQSIRAARENEDMVALKRERWTEAEIDALPAGEHDYFERKAGRLYGQGHFDGHVAKALSAFANTGGGHLVLGMQNDSVPDGMPVAHGGATMRDWLEQKVPSLLDHELHDFRVHQVVPSAASRIPAGNAVFVIDVGDSALAPHQSRIDHIHYHRQGGRSVPASSFYLELLRQRLTAPRLEFELSIVQPIQVARREGGVIVVLRLSFKIQNEGRVAAYKWRVRLIGADGWPSGRTSDIYPSPHDFPPEVRQDNVSLGDTTILPGDFTNAEKKIAVQIRPDPTRTSGLRDECALLLNTTFGFRVATEVSAGEDKPVVLGAKLKPEELWAYIVNRGLGIT